MSAVGARCLGKGTFSHTRENTKLARMLLTLSMQVERFGVLDKHA